GNITELRKGDWVTVSVSKDKGGRLIKGEKKIVQPTTISPEVKEYISWAKEVSRLRVRANGDTPEDAKNAMEFGAEGIGLTRTEHMFFAPDRLPVMQEMILNLNDETKMQDALNKLLPMQRKDFAELFEIMEGYPVTIRTLDPPLHEFLPKRETVQEAMLKLSKQLHEAAGIDSRLLGELNEKMRILKLIDFLHEINPMLGTRGARLGILMPAITQMQARAIAEAAVEVIKKGKKANVEIMIPLIGTKAELVHQKKIVEATIKEVIKEKGVTFTYKIGTMIEVPRAALTADEIAEEAEFFSFGTNDLTQMTFGLSRDDTGGLIALYRELGIYEADPFESIDTKGPGKLINMAVDSGRKVKPDLKIGICGEHG
ncbi:MAG: putative PEP-binding protein, partial [Bacteroidota bacterium]